MNSFLLKKSKIGVKITEFFVFFSFLLYAHRPSLHVAASNGFVDTVCVGLLVDRGKIIARGQQMGGALRRSSAPLRILHHHPHIIFFFFFFIRCNSQTTQATKLTQTRTQIPPPIIQSSPIKEGTRHGTIRVSKDSDGFFQHLP